jgi:predicted permease
VALCTVLLAAAGVLVRTFENLHRMDAGFDREHLVTFTLNPELNGYTPAQIVSLSRALIDRVSALPGVRSAATAGMPLMRGSGIKQTTAPTGRKTTGADFMNTSLNFVSPEYFDTMGIRILSGRGFTGADQPATKPMPVVVNQTFASRFFPAENPIGKTVGAGSNAVVKEDYQIVGVASDARYRSLREPIQPTIYQLSTGQSRFVLYVCAGMRSESLIAPVRQAIQALDPQLPIVEIHTLAEEVDTSLWSERLVAALASIFGALAALLSAIGLYGLLAHAVAQRRREIGVRVALGATPSGVFALVGRQAAMLAGLGVLIGIAGAVLALPLARNLLYGIAPADPLSLVLSTALIAIVAALATVVPAARALRVDPAIALRDE